MTGLFSPDSVEGFDGIRAIDRAVMLKEYLRTLEEETERIKVLVDDCCAQAVESGDTAVDGWKFTVRYSDGKSYRPDVTLLEENFPEKYKALVEEQTKAFKPKLAKADLTWLFSEILDKDELERKTFCIMVEHPVAPQYVFTPKKGGE